MRVASDSFLAELQAVPCISGHRLACRYRSWAADADDDGMVRVWPLVGDQVKKRAADLPQPARFQIVEETTEGKFIARVFDVVGEDGEAPYPHMSFIRPRLEARRIGAAADQALTDGAQNALLEHTLRAGEQAAREERERDGRVPHALEAFFREDKGLQRYALGAPGAPAAPSTGRYINRPKRSGALDPREVMRLPRRSDGTIDGSIRRD